MLDIPCARNFLRTFHSSPIAGAAIAALVGLTATSCVEQVDDPSNTERTAALAPTIEGERSLHAKREHDPELKRMRQFLEGRYRAEDVLHAFTLPSGDAVDCVEIMRQPSLRRPDMKNHALATPPVAPTPKGAVEPPPSTEGMEAFLQPGRSDEKGAERSCPRGTVPIRRLRLDDLARFKTLEDRLRKYPSDLDGGSAQEPSQGHLFLDPPVAAGVEPPLYGPSSTHQYAHAAQYGVRNVGAHVRINVWNPYVQVNGEFSLGQLWVTGGGGRNLQTLEAGVQTYPGLYGNSQPHIFIYSTSDGYGSAGCYNLDCGRFVQVDSSVVIGGSLSGASTRGGAQYEIELSWLLSEGNWWLNVNGTWVGYYPRSLFNSAGVGNGASTLDFGGEIIDDRRYHGYHTQTAMGSGAYPSAGWGQAAYQRQIYYYPNISTVSAATGLTASRSSAYCYDIALYHNDPNWGTYLYYGGPGYSANCQ